MTPLCPILRAARSAALLALAACSDSADEAVRDAEKTASPLVPVEAGHRSEVVSTPAELLAAVSHESSDRTEESERERDPDDLRVADVTSRRAPRSSSRSSARENRRSHHRSTPLDADVDRDVTVLGIQIGCASKAMPLQEVRKGGELVNDVIGGRPILATW